MRTTRRLNTTRYPNGERLVLRDTGGRLGHQVRPARAPESNPELDKLKIAILAYGSRADGDEWLPRGAVVRS
jgi:hypothetical protein